MSKQTHLHNAVQEKRKAMSMTQEELGRTVGVTRQTIIAIEKGNYTPSLQLALSLATQFQCAVEELFFYE